METEEYRKSIIQISKHEGFRSKVYLCPAGFHTIGYGRNLDTNGITNNEANILLNNDISKIISDLQSLFWNWNSLSINRKVALIDMMFWIGPGSFKGFSRMISAIRNENFIKASEEMYNSLLPKQSETRAKFLYNRIKEG